MKTAVCGLAVFVCVTYIVAQCTKDIDCKGDRICVDGECVSAQESDNTDKSSPSQKTGDPIGRAGFYLNPLGALQFGPIVGFEIGAGPDALIDLHWRYSATGLVYALILTEGFEHYMSMSSMAFGGGCHYFFPISSRHRPYIGGMVEYGWGSTWGEDSYDGEEYDADQYDAWEGSEAQIVAIFSGGMRWRFQSSFFINTGIMAGAAIDVKDEVVYINQRDTDPEDYRDVTFFGMLIFALGWEFGR